ncbi:ANTAR domain-containing protein [Thalassotalea sp. LPB0316]|uniref:ANTAR domain-containing response regulator n=1 Tax=Thalassotalea sp. LPB0316 TaxID=2769490 RepID=UPI001865A6F1|nr:ANTAR domain-containing protein [Thalassotalea sp. LPB0316]QOL24877.1 ANTAR domain-containing protein [Thalassotalea sp. LPB0316]
MNKQPIATIRYGIVYQAPIFAQKISNLLSVSQFSLVAKWSLDDIEPEIIDQPIELLIFCVERVDKSLFQRLNQLTILKQFAIVVFAKSSSQCEASRLASIGVNGYVEGPLPEHRIISILESALGRFRLLSKLQKDLTKTKQKLSSVKVVEQAKLSLMRAKQLNENDAYQLIRKTAMDNSQKIEDVAKNIVALEQLINQSH